MKHLSPSSPSASPSPSPSHTPPQEEWQRKVIDQIRKLRGLDVSLHIQDDWVSIRHEEALICRRHLQQVLQMLASDNIEQLLPPFFSDIGMLFRSRLAVAQALEMNNHSDPEIVFIQNTLQFYRTFIDPSSSNHPVP